VVNKIVVNKIVVNKIVVNKIVVNKIMVNMREKILKSKTISFSIRIVNCYKFLIQEKKEFVLSKQLLRSGTSVGQNF